MKKKKKRVNRRKKKNTKDAIVDALFKVLSDDDISFEKVKIVHLVKKARVARSSFYRNFNTVQDVLYYYLNKNIDELLASFGSDLSENWTIIAEHFIKNKDYYYTLYRSGSFHLLLDCFNNHSQSDDNYYFYGWSGFLYNILLIWIKNGMQEDGTHLFDIITKCTKKMSFVVISNKVS